MSVTLTEDPTQFIIQHGDAALVIDRAAGIISASTVEKSQLGSGSGTGSGAEPRAIAGVIGIIDLPRTKHLIVATSSKRSGDINGSPVFRVTATEIIPFNPQAHDDEYVKLLKDHLRDATLYYCPTYDLTSSAQRTAQLLAAQSPSTIDNRFFWNFEVSRELFPFPQFVFPLIYGVVSVANLTIAGQAVEFGVISRRSRFRAGTRYFRRGLDIDGNSANFNETEQLLWLGDRTYSFLQTRGSVPALWSEVNDLQYRPKLRIGDLEGSVAAASKHFVDQEQRYGDQYLVNLVNQSGYEKPVKDIYEAVVKQLNDPHLHYIYFDFHHECSKMRWHRVKLLVDQLGQMGFDEAGWFEARAGVPVRTQTAVVRTNCMDCLDRTNVVQSTLALYTLDRELHAAGLLNEGASVSEDPVFIAKFRSIWADNADAVSCAYSGTGALKTDFTRTGARTKKGALKDARNSVVRYFRNNLRDGPRQDGYSLFLGEHVPSGRESPFLDRRSLTIQSVPYIFGGCALVALLSILYPSETHSWLFNTVVTFVFGATAALSLKFIFAHGLQYVNWPKLSSVQFVQWNPRSGYYIAGEHAGTKEE